jgi:predicted Zn finger-like uncharacterized protein
MIINCINCNKKFEIDASLIPEKGRLLQCGLCNHKWHYVKAIEKDNSLKLQNEETLSKINEENYEYNEPLNEPIEENSHKKSKVQQEESSEAKKSYKKIPFLNIILVFLITFVALLVIVDTFQSQLISIIPEIEFILYNFYETVNDVILFLRDLF